MTQHASIRWHRFKPCFLFSIEVSTSKLIRLWYARASNTLLLQHIISKSASRRPTVGCRWTDWKENNVTKPSWFGSESVSSDQNLTSVKSSCSGKQYFLYVCVGPGLLIISSRWQITLVKQLRIIIKSLEFAFRLFFRKPQPVHFRFEIDAFLA